MDGAAQRTLRCSKNPPSRKEFRKDILRLVYACDEFCREFVPPLHARQVAEGQGHRPREKTWSLSEGMTLLLLFHTSGFRNFKTFSRHQVCRHLPSAFPRLVSYSRFVEWEADALLPLAAFLATRLGQCTGRSFIDSTPRKVCHTLVGRIFALPAQRFFRSSANHKIREHQKFPQRSFYSD